MSLFKVIIVSTFVVRCSLAKSRPGESYFPGRLNQRFGPWEWSTNYYDESGEIEDPFPIGNSVHNVGTSGYIGGGYYNHVIIPQQGCHGGTYHDAAVGRHRGEDVPPHKANARANVCQQPEDALHGKSALGQKHDTQQKHDARGDHGQQLPRGGAQGLQKSLGSSRGQQNLESFSLFESLTADPSGVTAFEPGMEHFSPEQLKFVLREREIQKEIEQAEEQARKARKVAENVQEMERIVKQIAHNQLIIHGSEGIGHQWSAMGAHMMGGRPMMIGMGGWNDGSESYSHGAQPYMQPPFGSQVMGMQSPLGMQYSSFILQDNTMAFGQQRMMALSQQMDLDEETPGKGYSRFQAGWSRSPGQNRKANKHEGFGKTKGLGKVAEKAISFDQGNDGFEKGESKEAPGSSSGDLGSSSKNPLRISNHGNEVGNDMIVPLLLRDRQDMPSGSDHRVMPSSFMLPHMPSQGSSMAAPSLLPFHPKPSRQPSNGLGGNANPYIIGLEGPSPFIGPLPNTLASPLSSNFTGDSHPPLMGPFVTIRPAGGFIATRVNPEIAQQTYDIQFAPYPRLTLLKHVVTASVNLRQFHLRAPKIPLDIGFRLEGFNPGSEDEDQHGSDRQGQSHHGPNAPDLFKFNTLHQPLPAPAFRHPLKSPDRIVRQFPIMYETDRPISGSSRHFMATDCDRGFESEYHADDFEDVPGYELLISSLKFDHMLLRLGGRLSEFYQYAPPSNLVDEASNIAGGESTAREATTAPESVGRILSGAGEQTAEQTTQSMEVDTGISDEPIDRPLGGLVDRPPGFQEGLPLFNGIGSLVPPPPGLGPKQYIPEDGVIPDSTAMPPDATIITANPDGVAPIPSIRTIPPLQTGKVYGGYTNCNGKFRSEAKFTPENFWHDNAKFLSTLFPINKIFDILHFDNKDFKKSETSQPTLKDGLYIWDRIIEQGGSPDHTSGGALPRPYHVKTIHKSPHGDFFISLFPRRNQVHFGTKDPDVAVEEAPDIGARITSWDWFWEAASSGFGDPEIQNLAAGLRLSQRRDLEFSHKVNKQKTNRSDTRNLRKLNAELSELSKRHIFRARMLEHEWQKMDTGDQSSGLASGGNSHHRSDGVEVVHSAWDDPEDPFAPYVTTPGTFEFNLPCKLIYSLILKKLSSGNASDTLDKNGLLTSWTQLFYYKKKSNQEGKKVGVDEESSIQSIGEEASLKYQSTLEYQTAQSDPRKNLIAAMHNSNAFRYLSSGTLIQTLVLVLQFLEQEFHKKITATDHLLKQKAPYVTHDNTAETTEHLEEVKRATTQMYRQVATLTRRVLHQSALSDPNERTEFPLSFEDTVPLYLKYVEFQSGNGSINVNAPSDDVKNDVIDATNDVIDSKKEEVADKKGRRTGKAWNVIDPVSERPYGKTVIFYVTEEAGLVYVPADGEEIRRVNNIFVELYFTPKTYSITIKDGNNTLIAQTKGYYIGFDPEKPLFRHE